MMKTGEWGGEGDRQTFITTSLDIYFAGMALMVVGTDNDYYNYDDNDNDGVKNTVRIETLNDPVPPCLRNLNPTINPTKPIISRIGSVLGKIPLLNIRVFMLNKSNFI